jgi:enoyl-[acyl-carrier protein] reductase II
LLAERGVDVIIAQGSEAGGMGGTVSALALIPQVVDAVRPIPVVAAGGIADGRGLAAALVLGAHGVNVSTRFAASVEASANDDWKQKILVIGSEDVVKVETWRDIFPRAIRTPFIEEWQQSGDDAKRDAERLRKELMATLQQGRLYELVPFTGQSAGLIRDILLASEIVYRIVNEAEEALKQANILLK